VTKLLLPHHKQLIVASGISDQVAAERGYWSATKPTDLAAWFGSTQRKLVPALICPIHNVHGETELVAMRPDQPRLVEGKLRKYELPYRCQMVVDVPPSARSMLSDPAVPLVITEGARKADAAVTAGLYAIDLAGVWTWRGKNEHGGLTALPCWEKIALNSRLLYMGFDSDAMEKREVHQALERLSSFLRDRGADIRYIYLPSGEGGVKTGLDDYLAAGHTRDDVLALATDELRPLPGGRPRPRSKPTVPPPATADLLRHVGTFIRRFVILPSAAGYLTVALFVLHTWAFEAAHATPYLVVESPEKQSGKTRLLEVLELLCWEPLKVASITAAALFQSVNGHHSTLLIDEADAIFAGNSERNEDLRAVLNAGNVPGSKAIRGGKDGNPIVYDVYCPKAIAGIATGRLPDTVRDRAIVVAIDRKPKHERVERLRRHRLEGELEALREQLRAWALAYQEGLHAYDLPEPLEQISDRLEEAWEPLLAIADLAGGKYPMKARDAAQELASEGDDAASPAHTLLIALREVFADEDKLASRQIAARLNENEQLPFGAWNDGKGITPAEIARLLKRYRIKPRTVRLPDGETLKGYHVEQFVSSWELYGGDLAVTSVTSQCSWGIRAFHQPSQDAECDGSGNGENPRQIRDVTAVTAKNRPQGAEAVFDTQTIGRDGEDGDLARLAVERFYRGGD
jgi:hypothetical protein